MVQHILLTIWAFLEQASGGHLKAPIQCTPLAPETLFSGL